MTKDSHLSIWFFVGILLTLNGLIITCAGIYGFFVPAPVHLAQYHADFWWGLILLAIGVFYCYHFAPLEVKSAFVRRFIKRNPMI
jgi:hypothetical protein